VTIRVQGLPNLPFPKALKIHTARTWRSWKAPSAT
jgi:hypothetical protein